MTLGSEYALYYQDILGAWHLTRFTPRPGKITCAFAGAVKDMAVPPEIRACATVTRT